MGQDPEKTFLEVINKNQRLIHKVCFLYASDAEDRKDLFQEIVIQLWRSFHSFRGEAKVSTWIYRIALNIAITGWRRKSRKPAFEAIRDFHENVPEWKSEEDDEKLQLLYRAIRQLSEVERAIIMLFLEELPYEEIALTVGITPNNVRVRMNRIREKLRKMMTHGD